MISLNVPPGKYVVAVSGGVDSVVLLDLLRQVPDIELVVAHFDHGIRDDSADDRRFVAELAATHDLNFVFGEGKLGPGVSEAAAREARYAFLHAVVEAQHADGIVTAHHQDDVLETAILNLLRGTGRKGLASLRSEPGLLRPFLDVPKQALVDYAKEHDLEWHEDSTNADDTYLRNYVRHQLVPRLGKKGRQKMLRHIRQAGELNPKIDAQLLLALPGDSIDRQWFAALPQDVACEALAAWLRQHGIRDFDRKTIDRLVVGLKTALPAKTLDVNAEYSLKLSKTAGELVRRAAS